MTILDSMRIWRKPVPTHAVIVRMNFGGFGEKKIESMSYRDQLLIHDILFLPISAIESGVSLRVVTHSRIRAWLVHA